MTTAHRCSLLLAISTIAACAGGAPPGFSSGTAWIFPLVGPLEQGVLITPVTFGDQGPYLFVIDPDASASSIDESLAAELGFLTGLGPRLLDESDTSRQTKVAEVPAMNVGTLTIKGRIVTLNDDRAFATDGRDIRGVVGRDVIADSLVFGFDRDGGVAFVATQESFSAPAQAIRIGYGHAVMRHRDSVNPTAGGPTGAVARRVARVNVNGVVSELHLDLGAVHSQLAGDRWKAARLAPVPYKAAVIDELATTRDVDKAGIANHVEVGAASAMGLVMIPYGDRRFDERDVRGTLALDFFAPYKVWANWDEKAFYLLPRDGEAETVRDRVARWNAPVLLECGEPACAKAHLDEAAAAPPPPADPAVPAPAPAPPTLVVTRETKVADLAYELLLEAVGADARPLGLPRLVVTFNPGTREVKQRVSPAFSGARFRVLDVDPFPRACPAGQTGCVYELAPAR